MVARGSDPDYYSHRSVLPLSRFETGRTMNMTQTVGALDSRAVEEDRISGISWAAIVAGSVVSSAFSLVLLTLGVGIGLVSVSPWSSNNPSPMTFGVLAGAWFIAMQLFSSGIGGYLSGRLRHRWQGVHVHESFFRDTAHGLIVWALGAIVSYWLLAMGASTILSGAAQVGGAAVRSAGSVASAASGPALSGASRGAESSDANSQRGYFVDELFRGDHPNATTDGGAAAAEAGRIFAHDAVSGSVSPEDKSYLAQLVATRTGLSQADAEKRVTDVIDQANRAKQSAIDAAKTAAEAARKSGVYIALWVFVSLLVGAFAASYMATVGGRVRDETSNAV